MNNSFHSVNVSLFFTERKASASVNFISNLHYDSFYIIIGIYVFLLLDLKINKKRTKLYVSAGPQALNGTRV
jgi:hypothetical protein